MAEQPLLQTEILQRKCKIKWWIKLIVIGIGLYGIYILLTLVSFTLVISIGATEIYNYKWLFVG